MRSVSKNSKDDVLRTQRRFWSKVDKSGDCWIWTAGKYRDGYGMFWAFGTNIAAHRFAYESAHGSIPDGMCVCHSCDRPACVNPNHLWVGTNAENHADKASKGRGGRGIRRRKTYELGESHPRAKLSDFDVLSMRSQRQTGASIGCLAKTFGISRSQVYRIVRREHWGHI